MNISVIVPIYKVEEYLPKCIESIINQKYKNLEIILVDDGSPDNCPKICDEYAEKDSRIKVIHKKNEGLIEARKSGVRESTGEYIAFVDGDDYISPNMYSMVAYAIEEFSPDMVMTEFFWSLEHKDIPSERTLFNDYYNRDEIEDEIIPSMLFSGKFYQFGIFPNCWTKIIKRELLINNIMGVDSRVRMGEDASFTYGCILDSESIAVVKEPLYYYRVNDSSMSKAYDSSLYSIWNIAYESILKKAESSNIDLSYQLRYYLLYMMNILVRNEASRGNNKPKTETLEAIKMLFKPSYIEEIKKIELSVLPSHTKILCKLIQHKCAHLIYLYSRLLRRFL